LGGIARRATLINSIRQAQPATLVVDAGDVFQGTPYYNQFKGCAEYETMSAAGYDLVTLGNHDFDGGVEALLKAMQLARFGFVSTNYILEDERLRTRIKPWELRLVGGRRVGLFGLGVILKGLVSPRFHQGLYYTPPIPAAAHAVGALKALGAEAIICLSHLGLEGYGGEPGDLQVAEAVKGIDLIVGGHSHSFLEQPKWVGQTAVVQVGHSGTHLGRVDLSFSGGLEASSLPVE